MDHARTKSRASQIKRPAIIAAIASALITGSVILANIDFSTHRVDRTKLSIEGCEPFEEQGQRRSKRRAPGPCEIARGYEASRGLQGHGHQPDWGTRGWGNVRLAASYMGRD